MIPQLLVSVRNTAEAAAALAGGASIIDVKEPRAGALGRASLDVIAAIADVARSQQVPCSAAFGEISEWLRPPIEQLPAGKAQLDYAKLGLVGAPSGDFVHCWAEAMQRIEAGCLSQPPQWIAVIYADWRSAGTPGPNAVLPAIETLRTQYGLRVAGVLIDTYSKTGGSLTDLMTPDELRRLRKESHEKELFLTLAGRLSTIDLPELVPVQPDVIAVRSAVCSQSDRLNAVNASAVAEFRAEMFRQFSEPGALPLHRATVPS